MAGPLDGVRVLDLTRMLPGNYCTWMLSSLGADVIKVEDTGAGDYMRDFGRQVDGQGALHHLVNRGKRSITVNLKAADGVNILLRMVDAADVLVESFRPGVMDRLGVGYGSLQERRPGLVYANVTGYGVSGPLAAQAGHDLNYLAFGGLLDRLGPYDGPPVIPPIAVADLIGGGLNTALGILALLFRSRVTGIGGRVDTALAESVALLPSNIVADLLAGEKIEGRGLGEFSGGTASYNVYRLADGFVTVGAIEARFWNQLCRVLGKPELIEARNNSRQDGLIQELLANHFQSMTRAEATELFAQYDVCVQVVQSYEEMFDSEQATMAGYLREVDDLSMRVLAPPFFIDGARPPETVRAPRQGEHSLDVLREVGYGEDEILFLMENEISGPHKGN